MKAFRPTTFARHLTPDRVRQVTLLLFILMMAASAAGVLAGDGTSGGYCSGSWC